MNAKGQTRRARDNNLNLLKLVVAPIYKASKLVIYNVSPYGDSILARVPPLKRTEALLRLAAAWDTKLAGIWKVSLYKLLPLTLRHI